MCTHIIYTYIIILPVSSCFAKCSPALSSGIGCPQLSNLRKEVRGLGGSQFQQQRYGGFEAIKPSIVGKHMGITNNGYDIYVR